MTISELRAALFMVENQGQSVAALRSALFDLNDSDEVSATLFAINKI